MKYYECYVRILCEWEKGRGTVWESGVATLCRI